MSSKRESTVRRVVSEILDDEGAVDERWSVVAFGHGRFAKASSGIASRAGSLQDFCSVVTE